METNIRRVEVCSDGMERHVVYTLCTSYLSEELLRKPHMMDMGLPGFLDWMRCVHHMPAEVSREVHRPGLTIRAYKRYEGDPTDEQAKARVDLRYPQGRGLVLD